MQIVVEAGTKTRAELKENWRDKTEAAAQLNGVDEEQQKVNNDDVMTNGYWITIKGGVNESSEPSPIFD